MLIKKERAGWLAGWLIGVGRLLHFDRLRNGRERERRCFVYLQGEEK